MKQKILLKIRSLTITLIVFCIIALTGSLLKIQNLVNHERYIDTRETKILFLANEFIETLDRLTWAVREYAITMEPRYIQQYWHTLEVEKKREQAINGLHALDIPKKELRLLNLAKENSDALVETEIRAMKLILLVFGVPSQTMHPAIREYKLTASDLKLSNEEKVNQAKEILFDDAYHESRQHALKPLLDFEQQMHQRTVLEERQSYRTTDYMIYFSLGVGVFTLLSLLLLVIIGRFLYVRDKSQ